MNAKLEINHLTYGYDKRTILKDITFQARSGSLVSLVGPNGSGKSTLLKNIIRILTPWEGCIRIDSKDVASMSRIETAKTVTYVPQSIQNPFPHSVYDVIYMGRRPHLGWFQKKVDKEKVWEIMNIMGLTELALRTFTELSGGQQQKVLIARALAQDTQLILLDEPTSNLDIWHQLDVLNVVHHLVKKNGVTVIMAMHDLNLAAKYSDDILMMKNGKLAALGDPLSVLTPDTISDVYRVKSHVATLEEQSFVIPLRQDNRVSA